MAHSFILKFGKYKGQNFSSTPKWYQSWLLRQEWFKVPTQLTEVQKAAKTISELSGQLKGWDGISKNGSINYDRIFDAEVKMDNAIFNDSNQYSPFYDGSY